MEDWSNTFRRWVNQAPGLNALRDISSRVAKSAVPSQLDRDEQIARSLGMLFHVSPIAACVCTLNDRRFTTVNGSFLQMTGYERDEVIGRTTDELALWTSYADRTRILEAISQNQSLRDVEAVCRTKQGENRYALWSVEQIDLGGDRGLLILAHDITERKYAEEKQQSLLEQVRASRGRLQALSKQLLDVQESERRQLARELHDEIGQVLTGLKFVLEAAGRAPAESAGQRLGEAQALVNDLILRVRNLSLGLRPAMLDDLGLLPALLWLIERYTAQTQVHVDFGHNGLNRRFLPEVETAAYRIVQEALTNVARHANESEASVRLWVDESLHLQVEDWGNGFDVDIVLAAGKSGGLVGMRERAHLLGGRLKIESVRGVGTRVEAELPLSGQRMERRENERNDSSRG